MRKTDTKSNTYRGQDVLIEKIKTKVRANLEADHRSEMYYTLYWDAVCDELAKDAAEEGLLSTEKSILALKEFPNNG